MRVSQTFSQSTYLRQLEGARQRRDEALLRLASGRRVLRPSDDPAATRRLLALADEASQAASQRGVVTLVRSSLSAAESALEQLGNVLETANAKAIQAASDTIDQDQRDVIADEIANLRAVVGSLAATRVGGRYIFSGTRPATPPYDGAGAYQGGPSANEVQLGEARITTGVTALEAFGESGSGPIGLLESLEAAMRAGDFNGIRAASESLEQAVGDASIVRARVGNNLGLLDSVDVALQERELRVATEAEELGAADLAKAISDAELNETGYQAALAAGARLFGPTLFDYIG